MTEKYHVVQPTMSKRDSQCWDTALIISTHKSAKEAFKHIETANKALKKIPGMQNSYRDWHVINAADRNLVEINMELNDE